MDKWEGGGGGRERGREKEGGGGRKEGREAFKSKIWQAKESIETLWEKLLLTQQKRACPTPPGREG